MTTNPKIVASDTAPPLARDNLNLVGGGGGSRAILAIAGMIWALAKADITKWRSIGGISGGALATIMVATGMKAADIVSLAIELDFASKLTRHGNIFQLFLALALKERYETTRPIKSVFSSEKVAEWVDERVSSWPDKYWNMSVHKDKQILFTPKGVYRLSYDGKVERLSDKPARVSDAMRGSIAIPGIIRPHYWQGKFLVDGALSWDGLTPVNVVLRHLAADPKATIACHVGERKLPPLKAKLKRSWKRATGGGLPWSDDERDPSRFAQDGVMLIVPELNKFGSLKFKLSTEEKWEAIISAFNSTVTKLEEHGWIDKEKSAELRALAGDQRRFIEDVRASR